MKQFLTISTAYFRRIVARFARWFVRWRITFEISPGIRIKGWIDEVIFYYLHRHEEHGEIEVFLAHLREGMTVLDIGANVGIYALHFARKVGPNGKVYAFEPVPEYFEQLKENISLNNVANIVPIPIALSNHKGVAKMALAGGSSSLFRHLSDQFIEVPLTTLDSFVAEYGLKRVDAIKVDVEGAELYVIRGADQTISNFKPILMVELHEQTLRAAGTTPEELFQTIVNYGYKAFVIRKGRIIPTTHVVRPMGYYVPQVTKQGAVINEFDNYLFLPKEG